jgi:hypothetical protein
MLLVILVAWVTLSVLGSLGLGRIVAVGTRGESGGPSVVVDDGGGRERSGRAA